MGQDSGLVNLPPEGGESLIPQRRRDLNGKTLSKDVSGGYRLCEEIDPSRAKNDLPTPKRLGPRTMTWRKDGRKLEDGAYKVGRKDGLWVAYDDTGGLSHRSLTKPAKSFLCLNQLEKQPMRSLLSFLGSLFAFSGKAKPNFVVVLVDDHAFEAISAYETYLQDFAKTWRSTAWPRKACVLTTLLRANSICSPSRASILPANTVTRTESPGSTAA